MRYLLYLLWSIISIVVLVLVTATILLTVFNQEVEEKLVAKIEANTGRNVDIQGELSFKFNPRPTLSVSDVKMQNASWGRKPWMLEIDSIDASLSFSGLLQGEITVAHIDINNPTMLIEKNQQLDEINWVFNKKRELKVFKKLADHLRIRTARIRGGEIQVEVGPIHHLVKLEVIDGKTNFFSKTITLDGAARLHDKALALSIDVDTLRSVLLREPTTLRFDGSHGQTRFKGQGSIQDLIRWQGIDIDLIASTPTLLDIQPWMSTRLIKTPRIDVTAKFVQPEKWQSARLEKILVSSKALAGQTTITGRVRQIKDWNGIDLVGQSSYPIQSLMQWKGLESTTDLNVVAAYSINGNQHDKLTLSIDDANISGSGVQVLGKGKIDHILQHNTQGIVFTLHADSLAPLGKINAKQWFETDALDGTFEIKRKDGNLAVDRINISAFSDRAQLTGSMEDIAKQRIGDYTLQAKLRSNDVKRINELNDQSFSVFDRTELDATIRSDLNHFYVTQSKTLLSSDGLQIKAAGKVDDLTTLAIQNMPVELHADTVANFNEQFGVSFPDFGTINATAELNGNINELFNINNIKFNVNNSLQSIVGQGDITKFGPDLTANLKLSADIDGFENVPPLFDSELEIPAGIKAKAVARLKASNRNNWSFTDISFNLIDQNQGTLTGSVKNLPNNTEYNLVADIQRIAADHINKYSSFVQLAPENVSFYAEIIDSDRPGAFALNNIESTFNLAAGKGSVNISGIVADISKFDGLDLNIGLVTSDINAIPYLSDLDFNDDMKGVGTARLTGTPGKLTLDFHNTKIEESDFRGTINIDSKREGRPYIKGEIASENVDAIALLRQAKRERLFSSEPLSLDWLKLADVELSFSAKRLNGVIAQLTNANMEIIIEDGLLNMPAISGAVGEGNLTAWLSASAQSKPYNIVTTLKGENIRPELINLFGDSELFKGGVIDIDIGLGGVGESFANYMDNSYGKIQLKLHDSSLKNEKIELFGSDLISGILNVINPFTKQQDYLPIECGVIHFPVVKGDAVASQGIAIKTDKVTVLGGGGIDLGTEELQILIKPKPRKGLGLSASTLASIAKVSGSFAAPKISIDSSSFLESTAKIGIAIASGGWSLLAQGLLNRSIANSDVCEQTLLFPNQKNVLERVANAFEFNESGER